MTRRQWVQLALRACGAGLAAGYTTAAPREADFVIIVHPSNRYDSLSRTKLSYLFLRKVSRWPWGAEVEPVEMAAARKIRGQFARQILRTTDEQLAEYWIDQRATRGVSAPVQAATAADVKALVAARPGAVAYIPYADLDSTVKALRVDA